MTLCVYLSRVVTLCVYLSRVVTLCVYLSPQDEENTSLAGRVKELEEERGRLHRTNAAQATQLDKFKKIAEDSKGKTESLETQLTANKKVIQ